MSKQNKSPRHVAIIMDGNRRWAKQHKLQIFKGHEQVAKERIDELVEHGLKRGIGYLTFWAFSTENWNRPQAEIKAILNLLRRTLATNLEKLDKRGVRFNTIGDLSRFPQDIEQQLQRWRRATADNQAITVTFALNYGGRDELLRAMRKLVRKMIAETKIKSKELGQHLSQELTETNLSRHLDTADLPDPDLIIRPGQERRLSGFMPWQGVYAELYFTKVLMPDFTAEEFELALQDYEQRQRRFGR